MADFPPPDRSRRTQRARIELFERMLVRNVDAYRQHEAWELIGMTDFDPPRH
ncbi:MAG: hypothetical protein AAGA90_18070 [Actinomycetota bacterium]